MPITVEEKYGRQVSGTRGERAYLIRGTENETEALEAMLDEAPASMTIAGVGTLPLNEDDSSVDEIEGVAGGCFEGRAVYGTSSGGGSTTVPDIDQSTYAFEIGGGSQTITVAKEHLQVLPVTGETNLPNYFGLINVDEDGTVNGVETPPPTPQIFTFTKTIAAASFTESYYRRLAALVHRTNDGPFEGFDEGECLFLGAAGNRRATDRWTIDFRIAVEANWESREIGGSAGSPLFTVTKKGWEYFWVFKRRKKDADTGLWIPKPVCGYVERIFDPGDFGDLNP